MITEPPGPPPEAEPTPAHDPSTGRAHRLPRPWRIALDWALTLAGAILIVLALKAWVINPYRIPTASMEPSLHCARPGSGCLSSTSDRVLANRFIYHFRTPHRGEIVVFHAPKTACGTGGTFVKRLIGLPGDTVSYSGGTTRVNGKALSEPYIAASREGGATGTWRVRQGRYFFMGDNRAGSCDSRLWGAVQRSALIGPVVATYWPLNRLSVNRPGAAGVAILIALAAVAVLLLAIRGRPSRRRARRSLG